MSWALPHVEEFDGQKWQQEASWEGRKVHEGRRLSHVPLPNRERATGNWTTGAWGRLETQASTSQQDIKLSR